MEYTCGCLNFYQKICSADIGLKIKYRSLWCNKTIQFGPNDRQIREPPQINLVGKVVEVIWGSSRDAICLCDDGGDIRHAFACLRRDIPLMPGLMPDDAGRSGNKENFLLP